eukprot:8805086-Pyramimonas_sp.AAC.1
MHEILEAQVGLISTSKVDALETKLDSLPRLCLEGLLLFMLKGPGSGPRLGRFPQDPPRGSPSYVPLA